MAEEDVKISWIYYFLIKLSQFPEVTNVDFRDSQFFKDLE